MGLIDSISGLGEKVVDKIPSENDRNKAAIEVLQVAEGRDLKEADISSRATKNQLHFWLEVMCALCFAYTYLLVPILNDVFNLHFKGIQNQEILDNLLYAMLGLSGIRIANSIINKK